MTSQRHIGVQKQWNGGHVGVPNQSSGSWTLFFCKRFLLFQEICIDAGHVSENTLLNWSQVGVISMLVDMLRYPE